MQTSSRISLAAVGTLIVLGIHLPSAIGQDFGVCSADEVTSAIDELGCFADGVYLSPDSAAEQVAAMCADAPSANGCHSCFMKSRTKLLNTFKTLVKLELLDRSAVGALRLALKVAENDTCSDFNSPPPEDTPQTDPPFSGSFPQPSPEHPSPPPSETSAPFPSFAPTSEPAPGNKPGHGHSAPDHTPPQEERPEHMRPPTGNGLHF